jgi:hypothetical protein
LVLGVDCIPRGVRSLTFFLSRSPELIDASCGNFFIKRSVCVPFPTPGAPTRITRAALDNCGAAIVEAGVEEVARQEMYAREMKCMNMLARNGGIEARAPPEVRDYQKRSMARLLSTLRDCTE